MDYGLIAISAVGIAVILWWIMLEPLVNTKESKDEEAKTLLSDAELNKMTKGKLEEYGRTVGVELDKRLTKANMIAALKNS